MSVESIVMESHQKLAIKKHLLPLREAYLDHMTFKHFNEPFFTEIFGPLIGLKEAWKKQGATNDELNMSIFKFRAPQRYSIDVHCGFFDGRKQVMLENTEEHILFLDGMGRRMRLKKGVSSLPLPETWPVKDIKDWLQIKPHFIYRENRLGEDWLKCARKAQE